MRAFATVTFLVLLVSAAPSASIAEQTLGWPGNTFSGFPCFGKMQGYGPFDYTTRKDKLEIVERYHFTPDVERLIRGESSSVMGDIDYTLRAFPNHHRALWAAARYYLARADKVDHVRRIKRERAQAGGPPPECYFQRAKVLAPQDGMVPAIYGIYLHKSGKLEAALAEYKLAEERMPDFAELSYNMGLLYFDMKQIDKAKEYAAKAREFGYPLTGLSSKIDRYTNNAQDKP